MKKNRDTGEEKEIINLPARKIYGILPHQMKIWMKKGLHPHFRYRACSKREEAASQAEEFIIQQISLFFWGCMTIFVLGVILRFGAGKVNQIHLKRNGFGQGKKQVMLKMEDGNSSAEISYDVEEQQVDEKEIGLLCANFFQDLKEELCGENPSLEEVSSPLHFADELKGYPFHIQYEVKNLNCIKLDGTLGEDAKNLKAGTLETEVTAIAVYHDYEKEKSFHIVVIPEMKKTETSPFVEAENELIKIERNTRKQSDFSVPSQVNGIKVTMGDEKEKSRLLIFFTIIIVIGMGVRKYEELKKTGRENREMVINDFPVIVHLLSLYIDAGLSFARAIHRISEDYKMGFLTGSKTAHYAFDEVVAMDIKMQTGLSQKEACEQWAKDMEEPVYRKLSLLLMQGLSKGSGEVGAFMNGMEREVFNAHIDRVKKRGEEASAKLLFPMVVLMGLVMILVMFPALMQLSNF